MRESQLTITDFIYIYIFIHDITILLRSPLCFRYKSQALRKLPNHPNGPFALA